jgi:hypothetical protein
MLLGYWRVRRLTLRLIFLSTQSGDIGRGTSLAATSIPRERQDAHFRGVSEKTLQNGHGHPSFLHCRDCSAAEKVRECFSACYWQYPRLRPLTALESRGCRNTSRIPRWSGHRARLRYGGHCASRVHASSQKQIGGGQCRSGLRSKPVSYALTWMKYWRGPPPQHCPWRWRVDPHRRDSGDLAHPADLLGEPSCSVACAAADEACSQPTGFRSRSSSVRERRPCRQAQSNPTRCYARRSSQRSDRRIHVRSERPAVLTAELRIVVYTFRRVRGRRGTTCRASRARRAAQLRSVPLTSRPRFPGVIASRFHGPVCTRD